MTNSDASGIAQVEAIGAIPPAGRPFPLSRMTDANKRATPAAAPRMARTSCRLSLRPCMTSVLLRDMSRSGIARCVPRHRLPTTAANHSAPRRREAASGDTLDAESPHPRLDGLLRQPEQFRGLGRIAARALERLPDEVHLDLL